MKRTFSNQLHRIGVSLIIISLAASSSSAFGAAVEPSSTTPAASSANPTASIPSAEGLVAPNLTFIADPATISGYDKFYYFHRSQTTFQEAYDDLRECEGLANGSNLYRGGDPAAMGAGAAQYGALASAVGGVIVSALADAIFGAAARRKEKRIKIRNCMGFKDYQRYGLPKAIWQQLNFKSGGSGAKAELPDLSLRLRALVASGPAPTQEVLPK